MKPIFSKVITLILCAAIAAVSFSGLPVMEADAAEPVVIVIDPGHGGENLGTDYLPIPEKTYTMTVASFPYAIVRINYIERSVFLTISII